jgi:threonylcarbamoyladenosine tRNA methylthiotransferase MtaB
MSGLDIVTFGCRLNLYESEIIRAQATAAGLSDAIVVNTCAVTAEAERQARQTIRRLRRERPTSRIIVTGCAAQIAPERFAAMPEIDQVIGNLEKLSAASYGATRRVAVADIMTVRETASHLVEGFDGHSRAFLQVQQGCDHRCTFCVIPYGRGNSRSLPLGQVVEQARAIVGKGYREIVLSGVDITAFGADLPGKPSLGQLVRRLLALVPDLPRLRLSSLDPVEIDEDLWRLIGEEKRLMPHLHLSLQSGDDLVLKRMKRRHGRDDALAACRRARTLRPGIALGADLIAGFPTESEAMFANTLSLIAEADLTHLHVFPYSARQGTPAARMPQPPGPVIRARAAALREAGTVRQRTWLAGQVGSTVSVLVERDGSGRSEHYARVELVPKGNPGTLVAARIIGAEDDALIGEPLDARATA